MRQAVNYGTESASRHVTVTLFDLIFMALRPNLGHVQSAAFIRTRSVKVLRDAVTLSVQMLCELRLLLTTI